MSDHIDISRERELISDAEVNRVHGYANFGGMTPRDVIRDGVQKYAVGYAGGATQIAILREHGLITKPKGIGYAADLTKKGKSYGRVIYQSNRALRAALDAAEAEKARAVEAETERCAAMLDTEADKCDNAARWGGSKRYVTDCKAAAYALRDRAAAIRTGVKP